jgi:hypothetical protein
MTSYINPWHRPDRVAGGPEKYTTDVKPTEYRGFLIYERIKGKVWDVVKDGKCVTQRAGIHGAQKAIDSISNIDEFCPRARDYSDERSAQIEAYWQAKQGDEYGSY